MQVTKTRGQVFEGIAFSFCKAATVGLVFQKFALPVAAILCAIFYLLSAYYGQRESRCILRVPLVIAGFWIAVAAAWTYIYLK